MSEHRIIEIDPDDGITPDSNRPIRDEDIVELLEDMRANGQQFPGQGAPHATLPRKYVVSCGNKRKRCCKLLNIPFRLEVLDRPYLPGEVVQFSIGDHLKRKNPDVFELSHEVTAFKLERKIATWAEVAEELRLTPPTLSRILGVKRYTEELRAMTNGLCGTTIQIIGKLETHDMMRQALAFASSPDDKGNLPSKSQVELFIKRLKGTKRGRKPKCLSIKIEGRTATIELKPGDKGEQIGIFGEALTKRVAKYRDIPAETLGFLST